MGTFRAGATLHMSSEEAETEAGDDPEEQESQENGETEEQDPRLYSVRISRVTGIEWGTDISFAWVYIRELQPSGSAANSGKIAVGDQVCVVLVCNMRVSLQFSSKICREGTGGLASILNVSIGVKEKGEK